jgi:hypothetical protein
LESIVLVELTSIKCYYIMCTAPRLADDPNAEEAAGERHAVGGGAAGAGGAAARLVGSAGEASARLWRPLLVAPGTRLSSGLLQVLCVFRA